MSMAFNDSFVLFWIDNSAALNNYGGLMKTFLKGQPCCDVIGGQYELIFSDESLMGTTAFKGYCVILEFWIFNCYKFLRDFYLAAAFEDVYSQNFIRRNFSQQLS
jgi:hypothetical protein